jgi:hypothetical protein
MPSEKTNAYATPGGEKASQKESGPLVAREFKNRDETIATAFSREAWT